MEVALDRTLAWTVTVNAETYELERDGLQFYVGPDLSLAPITTNSIYRVRALNLYGAGPWSTPFALGSSVATVTVDARRQTERESFTTVTVAVGGNGAKIYEAGAGRQVTVAVAGGGIRDGVNASVLVEVTVGGGGTANRAGGAGASVAVGAETGYHPGAILSLEAISGLDLAFLARIAEELDAVVTTEVSGRVRRRRHSLA